MGVALRLSLRTMESATRVQILNNILWNICLKEKSQKFQISKSYRLQQKTSEEGRNVITIKTNMKLEGSFFNGSGEGVYIYIYTQTIYMTKQKDLSFFLPFFSFIFIISFLPKWTSVYPHIHTHTHTHPYFNPLPMSGRPF